MASTFQVDLENAAVKLRSTYSKYFKPPVFSHHIRAVKNISEKLSYNYNDVLLYLSESYKDQLYSVSPRGPFVYFELLFADSNKFVQINGHQYKITTSFPQTKLVMTHIPHEFRTEDIVEYARTFGKLQFCRRDENLGRRHRATFFFSEVKTNAKEITKLELTRSSSILLDWGGSRRTYSNKKNY
mmetsp:Transcript_98245/g.147321  ORF Transcript_98245/g.147321 Transcript_98245/m.147321 type:complete len:185 (-) Transcript_98245:130-684(-)